jgi:hypothetical protein
MKRMKLLMVKVQPVIAIENEHGQCEQVIEEDPKMVAAAEWSDYSQRLERELEETQAKLNSELG